MRTPWAVGALGLLLASCSGTPGAGLAITVNFASNSQSRCAIVGVQKEMSSNVFETVPGVPRGSRNSIIVGVERTSSIRGRVLPFAEGYKSADCSGASAEHTSSSDAIDLDIAGVQQASLTLEGDQTDGGTGGGAGGGAGGGDAGTNPFPYAPSNFNPMGHVAQGAVVINCAMTFDSSDGGGSWCGGPAPAVSVITMDAGVQAWLIAAQSFSVTPTGTLRLRGTLPVVIAVYSTGQTSIDGNIFANSDLNSGAGAGSRTRGDCGAQAGGDSVNLDHGGAGAGYGTVGAPGANLGVAGTIGPVWPVPLYGGCPGGPCTSGAQGGRGGGALQISVAGELRISAPSTTGGISVSGGGGRGGSQNPSPKHGGGGGGSGGVLLLEGNSLNLTSSARLTANGGAGGEGGDSTASGSDAKNGSVSDDTPASCPAVAPNGGNGGQGGTRGNLPSPGLDAQSNGGSGGAVGRIFVRSNTATCVAAMPASQISPRYTVVGPNCLPSP